MKPELLTFKELMIRLHGGRWCVRHDGRNTFTFVRRG